MLKVLRCHLSMWKMCWHWGITLLGGLGSGISAPDWLGVYFFSTSSGEDAFLISRLSLEWKWLGFLKEEQTCFLAHSDWGRGWGETSPSNGWVWLNSVYPTSFHLTVKLLEGRGYHEVVRIWPLELGKSAFAHGPRGSWGSWWNSEASYRLLESLWFLKELMHMKYLDHSVSGTKWALMQAGVNYSHTVCKQIL